MRVAALVLFVSLSVVETSCSRGSTVKVVNLDLVELDVTVSSLDGRFRWAHSIAPSSELFFGADRDGCGSMPRRGARLTRVASTGTLHM